MCVHVHIWIWIIWILNSHHRVDTKKYFPSLRHSKWELQQTCVTELSFYCPASLFFTVKIFIKFFSLSQLNVHDIHPRQCNENIVALPWGQTSYFYWFGEIHQRQLSMIKINWLRWSRKSECVMTGRLRRIMRENSNSHSRIEYRTRAVQLTQLCVCRLNFIVAHSLLKLFTVSRCGFVYLFILYFSFFASFSQYSYRRSICSLVSVHIWALISCSLCVFSLLLFFKNFKCIICVEWLKE